MRLATTALVAVATLGFIAASGCMTRAVPAARSLPALAAPGEHRIASALGVAGAPSTAADLGAASREALAQAAWPQVTAVLDDPRLLAVKQLVAANDAAAAATALDGARLALQPSAEDDSRWAYQVGRLRQSAGDLVGAARAFDDAALRDNPLQSYAKLGAAQVLLRAGRVEEAKLRADQVEEGCSARPFAELLIAEALALRGEPLGAAALYDSYLAGQRHPARWIEVALRSAEAWLAAPPDAKAAENAARLARRVLVEAPTSPAVPRALDVHERALSRMSRSARAGLSPIVGRGKGGALLPGDWARGLSVDEQLTRATALVEQHAYSDADKAIDALATASDAMGAMDARAASAARCRAELLRGSRFTKTKERARAADAYGAAIVRCQLHRDALAEALYFGGKASAAAGRHDEARARFGAVESDFPDHRLADDARLRGAESALELGDEQRYSDALRAMPAQYPDGDMVPEGLFRLALHGIGQGRWAEAVPLLEAAQAFKIQEGPSPSAGRLAYFAARARLASGDIEGGKSGLARVIRSYPLSYYMLQAYGRLAALDRVSATALLDEVLAREPPGALIEGPETPWQRPEFVRAVELLRQGETDYARRELTRLGTNPTELDARGERAGDTEERSSAALWAVAALYARAGLPQQSHAIPRARVFDWLGHYPAGRWRAAWELAYPRAFADVVEREAKKNGIPPSLAYAVMREESSFDPEAQSPSRAYGLMQLIVPTAKRVGRDLGIACDESSLVQPETNVALGTRFLADLRAKFPNPHVAISAYNAGPGASQRWIESRANDDFDLWVERIPYEETRKYTKRVLASFAAYAFLYEREALSSALYLPRTVIAP